MRNLSKFLWKTFSQNSQKESHYGPIFKKRLSEIFSSMPLRNTPKKPNNRPSLVFRSSTFKLDLKTIMGRNRSWTHFFFSTLLPRMSIFGLKFE
jgi:hypothetical protein